MGGRTREVDLLALRRVARRLLATEKELDDARVPQGSSRAAREIEHLYADASGSGGNGPRAPETKDLVGFDRPKVFPL